MPRRTDAPLSARSVVASTLLGTVPPRLPGRLLVAFAEEFGINAGTTRVALSRMVDRGELRRDNTGAYELCGSLLERQGRQTAGLTATTRPWTGAWEIHVVRSGGRGSTARTALRRAALHLGLRERREGVWLRPDNLDPDRLLTARATLVSQADRFVGEPTGASDPARLAAELFDLDSWAATAVRLETEMSQMTTAFDGDGGPSLARGFELAAVALRHLVADPLLPAELCPDDWPASSLRSVYEHYDDAYRTRLSAFFRLRSRLAG
jgi:phenylacetic acid degradation operon negative regulatory protein